MNDVLGTLGTNFDGDDFIADGEAMCMCVSERVLFVCDVVW